MTKNPIPKVSNKLQYRAIGIINGIYTPNDLDKLNRGILIDDRGEKLEAVVLGKALSLLKKHIDLKEDYFWIVYPKNKNTQNLHLQIVGIWEPYKLNKVSIDSSKKNLTKLLNEFNLTNNYFSIRGELVFVSNKKKEFVIKICSSQKSKNLKNNFKLVIKGELSLEFLNSFISLDIIRKGNTLFLSDYEIIERNLNRNE